MAWFLIKHDNFTLPTAPRLMVMQTDLFFTDGEPGGIGQTTALK